MMLSIFRHLEPFRCGSRVSQTDGRSDIIEANATLNYIARDLKQQNISTVKVMPYELPHMTSRI